MRAQAQIVKRENAGSTIAKIAWKVRRIGKRDLRRDRHRCTPETVIVA